MAAAGGSDRVRSGRADPISSGPTPFCELDTEDELLFALNDPRADPFCKTLAQQKNKAIGAGVLTITKDGRIIPNPNVNPGMSPQEKQVFHAWQGLMYTMGVTVPKLLTRATFYRARLDDAVR